MGDDSKLDGGGPAPDAAGKAERGNGGLDQSNMIRAGLFGVQDGMVSNFGLIMGVAGAQVSPEAVLIAGIAGLLSGGLSMGAGEYVSVATQREMLEAGQVVEADDNVRATRAAFASSGLFALGAFIPLLPFLFTAGMLAVTISSILTGVSLFTAGAILTKLTKRSPWRSGVRILVIGGGAGILAYVVGSGLGVAVG